MRGAGLWYYDFGPRESFGWWDNSVYLSSIEKEKALFDSLVSQPYKPAADVLYVWDQESFYHVKNGWTPVCYNLIDQSFEEALRSGTIGDQIYLFDLDKVDLEQYKAVMFMNVYKMMPEQRDFIKRVVARDGRTLIWNYMPGYTDGQVNRLEFVEELTGFKLSLAGKPNEAPIVQIKNTGQTYSFEAPVDPMALIEDDTLEILAFLKDTNQIAVARKKFRDHVSVYATLPIHNTGFFRKLLGEAGCWVYNESDDFTYVNSGLLLIHSKEGGITKLRLTGGQTVEYEIPPYSTWILDEGTGRVLLK
jgi:hypothetical protein